MFMTLGTNAYTAGGGVKDPLDTRRDIVSRMGLNNEGILKSAKMPGSVTRARMTDSGIPVELQNEVLELARSQNTFKAKGGYGEYDPGNKKHREVMGIEENFATQTEETTRQREEREEDFMKRQIDNLAAMEKNTQKMVGYLGSIDEKMSGLLGVRASTRTWTRAGGTALQVAGAAAMFVPGGQVPGAIAMGLGGVLGSGDGDESKDANGGGSGGGIQGGTKSAGNDGNIKVPFGYNGNRITLNELKSKSTFSGMNPRMKTRLLAAMRANPNLGVGGGTRDPSQQEAMFRDRYRKTGKKTGVRWQGAYWERVKGAPAAPPGRSMHEIGLAADLVGDLNWLQANASRFGLKTFADVNNEPWHVQPSELPNSRRKYEEGGSQWGSDGGFEEDASFNESGSGSAGEVDSHPGGGYGGSSLGNYSGMSISDIIEAMADAGAAGLSLAGPGGRVQSSASAATSAAMAIPGSGAEVAARAAFDAGFRGEDLFKIVAIAGRESGFDATAINESSNDTGMWQIAPMNWGQYSQQQLLNPNTNAKVAFDLFQSSGFHGWKAASSRRKEGGKWVVDPSGKGGPGWASNGDELWNTGKHQDQSRSAIQTLPSNVSGDPMPSERGGSQQVMAPIAMSKPMSITVAPQITFTGTPSTPDLQAIAHQVTAMIEKGVRDLEMRNA